MKDIIIIGGGLAGLCNAIHLSKAGLKVMLIEKNEFPKHKVCGEYISNEVLPYLDYLGVNPFDLGATSIARFQLSTPKGKLIETQLPLGGFGISRYTLDHALYQKALENGVEVKQIVAESLTFDRDSFIVSTKAGEYFHSKFVIGAYGKRTNLDFHLKRNFVKESAPFLAVKAHYAGEFPEDLVSLHNFAGGYCGVSKVENGHINICYLADFEAFKKHKNISTFQEKVLYQNPHLNQILSSVEPLFDKPLTISQISFLPKPTVDQHVLMSGDAAGMIHPLCGNGMGMAIHSALILSGVLIRYFEGGIKSRTELESAYSQSWEQSFRTRLFAGRFFNAFFRRDKVFEYAIRSLTMVPWLLPVLIRQTHGKELIP